ncbi:hypothetical protein DUI87_12885 [Hirundo rustica rustica]|uniref:Uncharacterized protein n=1 Tax=Hirundo rustica rustica TaxID=333673 RepID=A0A3M0KSH8_HIRRU|nr:hypothetical protein DUI87_12885 [Hirundo rustica rustica]
MIDMDFPGEESIHVQKRVLHVLSAKDFQQILLPDIPEQVNAAENSAHSGGTDCQSKLPTTDLKGGS